MQPFETILVDSNVVACNGGGGPLGHPRVYLKLSAEGRIECPYCSRLYVLRGKAAAGDVAATPPVAPGAHPPPAAPDEP
ncbi:MAG TPA: zinc-finger domain-containing protein [Stellaceae bacterium]